jgi:DNA polymerase beta
VTRDKDEKRAKKVAADSIMGKVLIALSKASLLDPEMMFSEGIISSPQGQEGKLMKGEKKSMFLTRLPYSPGAVYRQIDIRLCPTESLPYMLLGNSGDDSLMKLLRWRAMEKGLALNEYGMGKRSNEVVRLSFQLRELS